MICALVFSHECSGTKVLIALSLVYGSLHHLVALSIRPRCLKLFLTHCKLCLQDLVLNCHSVTFRISKYLLSLQGMYVSMLIVSGMNVCFVKFWYLCIWAYVFVLVGVLS